MESVIESILFVCCDSLDDVDVKVLVAFEYDKARMRLSQHIKVVSSAHLTNLFSHCS